MNTPSNSQKFIAQNRAPRVQIEYDVEENGRERRLELPFVMGVMADLCGQPARPLPPVAERRFLDINVDNFDERMAALRPRVAFHAPNTLTGEGRLPIELQFEKLEDFGPAAIARRVEPLRRLLDIRAGLATLLTHMDGNVDAARVMSQLLRDPRSLAQLAADLAAETAAATTGEATETDVTP
jgi:type VI secretion system protein ImpB